MSSHGSRGGLWEELTADPLTFLTVVAFLSLVGPGVLLAFRDQVAAWLVAHHVMVAYEQAVVVIPFTSGGLDARRLLVLGLLLLAVAFAFAAHLGAAHRRKRAGR